MTGVCVTCETARRGVGRSSMVSCELVIHTTRYYGRRVNVICVRAGFDIVDIDRGSLSSESFCVGRFCSHM